MLLVLDILDGFRQVLLCGNNVNNIQSWRAGHRPPEPTIYDVPDLPHGLCILQDTAYQSGKVGTCRTNHLWFPWFVTWLSYPSAHCLPEWEGRETVQCFHLHYLLLHYCDSAEERCVNLDQLIAVEHFHASREAFQLFVELSSTKREFWQFQSNNLLNCITWYVLNEVNSKGSSEKMIMFVQHASSKCLFHKWRHCTLSPCSG
jgi:hypothetical protein